MTIPYFTKNGAIVMARVGNGFRVSPGEGIPAVIVETAVEINGSWLVTFPPWWLHTDEECARACQSAREAVAEMLSSKEVANA